MKVPATQDERRYFVLDAGSAHKQNTAYFAAIDQQMFGGGANALMHLLLTRPITCDLRSPPRTAALAKQIVHGFDGPDRWLFEAVLDGEVTVMEFGQPRRLRLSKTSAIRIPRRGAYDAMQKMAKHAACNDLTCATLMDKLSIRRDRRMPAASHRPLASTAATSDRPRALELPSLPSLRARFERHYRIKLVDVGGVK